jgi:hypothetical protein
MLWVSMHWQSDGTSVLMLVEDMSRNTLFFQVRIPHVLYPFVTYLLTLPRIRVTYICSTTHPRRIVYPSNTVKGKNYQARWFSFRWFILQVVLYRRLWRRIAEWYMKDNWIWYELRREWNNRGPARNFLAQIAGVPSEIRVENLQN